MGTGYSGQCGNCDYKFTLFLGFGFMTYKIGSNEPYYCSDCNEFISIMIPHEETDRENKIPKCDNCGSENVLPLVINELEQNEQESKYGKDREVYHISKCPKCKQDSIELFGDIMWD